MEKLYNTDDFLAKWISGELSEKDKKEFEKTNEYKSFKAILEGTDVLEVPKYDKDAFFNRILEKKKEMKKVRPLFPKWVFAIAASVALLFGYFTFFNNNMNYETGFGEQLTFMLSDNSEVILNANSKLSYHKKGWENERNLTLNGTGYFKVSKGSIFTVLTENGTVTVLGTKFTVNSTQSIFEVICFEGRVTVKSHKDSKIITKGEAVRLQGGSFESWNIKSTKPSWIDGESSFVEAPIHQVIKSLEDNYNVVINSSKINNRLRFTGSFTNNSLETALRTVFDSMEISFTFSNETTIDLAEE